MEKLKKDINELYAEILIGVTLIGWIIYLLGYEYRPRSYIVFAVLYFSFIFAATFLSVRYRKTATEHSRKFGVFMPITAFVFGISTIAFVDLRVNETSTHVELTLGMFAAVMISALVLFFTHCRKKWFKIVVAVVLSAIFILNFYGLAFIYMMMHIGKNTVKQTVKSPDNTYEARVICYDEGALGGDTCVYARNTKRTVGLIVGVVRHREVLVKFDDYWDANPELVWIDDENLSVDGEVYNIPELCLKQ